VEGDKLAAIGYCFGGTAVLELAYSGAAVDAVVSFHGSVLPPMEGDDLGEVQASVLICHGIADPLYGLDELHTVIEALERGGVDYAVYGYGHAVHSFTNPGADGSFHPGVNYDASADQRSWKAMKNWLAEANED
jgi:dienelactone hydrolase